MRAVYAVRIARGYGVAIASVGRVSFSYTSVTLHRLREQSQRRPTIVLRASTLIYVQVTEGDESEMIHVNGKDDSREW